MHFSQSATILVDEQLEWHSIKQQTQQRIQCTSLAVALYYVWYAKRMLSVLNIHVIFFSHSSVDDSSSFSNSPSKWNILDFETPCHEDNDQPLVHKAFSHQNHYGILV